MFFVLKDGKEYGPLTPQELKRGADSGELLPKDHIRPEDRQNWVVAANVKGLFAAKPDGATETPPPLPISNPPAVPPPVPATPPPVPSPATSQLDHNFSDTFGMEDAGDLGIGAAVKSTVNEFKSLDYGFLIPFKEVCSTSLLRKKAVRWVIGFGLFPLLLLFLKEQCNWSFEGSAWWLGGYFCLFWAAYFHGLLQPQGKVWQRGLKWALFTVAVGLPLLLVAQQLPVIKTFYSGTHSKSLLFRLAGFVLGVGILEETCKALPLLLFVLRKKEVISLKSGIFLGMMSGFGFALAEVVQYSMQYWQKNASASVVAIAQAIDNSTDLAGRIHADVFGKQVGGLLPQLVEVSGNVLLAQLVRFMTLPLLHACWAGVVGWFVATASQRKGNPWVVVAVGVVFMATMHGLYDVFSDDLLGIGIAAASLLVFMGYLIHGQDDDLLASHDVARSVSEPTSSITA